MGDDKLVTVDDNAQVAVHVEVPLPLWRLEVEEHYRALVEAEERRCAEPSEELHTLTVGPQIASVEPSTLIVSPQIVSVADAVGGEADDQLAHAEQSGVTV